MRAKNSSNRCTYNVLTAFMVIDKTHKGFSYGWVESTHPCGFGSVFNPNPPNYKRGHIYPGRGRLDPSLVIWLPLITAS